MRHERIHLDVESQLARALTAAALAAGITATIQHKRSRPWSSATFVGAQHVVTLVVTADPAARDWLAGLADAEFALRGHIVASVAVDAIEDNGGAVRATLAVLTLEDG